MSGVLLARSPDRRVARGAATALLALVLAACDGVPAGVSDLDGTPVNPFEGAPRATVTVFVDTDCPISNRYAPELGRLRGTFGPLGVRFWLVYPDAGLDAESIREHRRAYGLEMPALRDPEHALVDLASATVTPEAAVFLPDGSLAYHGRIDDRFVDLGVQRATPTRRDLQEVLEALMAGRAIPAAYSPPPGRSLASASGAAVGCYIQDFARR